LKSPGTVLLTLLLGFSVCFQAHASALEDATSAFEGQRFSEARVLLEPLAANGVTAAKRMLGEMYYAGKAVPLDKALALKWTAAAAEEGDRLAEFSMGYLYELGDGVVASKRLAQEYYRRSALQKFVPAMVKLADLLIASDTGAAKYWYQTAAQYGNEEARQKFSRLGKAEVNAASERYEAGAKQLKAECANACVTEQERVYCEAGMVEPATCSVSNAPAPVAQWTDNQMPSAQPSATDSPLRVRPFQNQTATRLAEAANARRFQQQIDAGKAEVARNQQRFAEERARLEAQRGRLQQQQAQQAPQPQQQRQVVAQADVRQAQQAQLQREQEAAAAQRAQATQRLEAGQQNRAAAQTLAAAASNARTPSGGGSGGSAGSPASASEDSRIKLHGTMYVVHYAALKHSRSDKNNVTLVERITPVQWTYDVPRVSPLQQPSGPSNAVPYQVSDLLLKQMRPRFFDYLRDKYTICIEGSPAPDGCHGWSVYSQIGNSAAEVQGKLNASLTSFSAPVTNGNGLDYPPSIAYSE